MNVVLTNIINVYNKRQYRETAAAIPCTFKLNTKGTLYISAQNKNNLLSC